MKKYKFLEEVATADVAFKAEGDSLEELFEACALATFDVMIDLKKVEPKEKRHIELENEKIDQLLFDFLEEIIFLKDSDYIAFSKFDIKIKKNKKYKLIADAYGENINLEKHESKSDVKAVTYHMFEVKQENKKWKATVVLDI